MLDHRYNLFHYDIMHGNYHISTSWLYLECLLAVWCAFKKSNRPFICSKLVMGLPSFSRWKIITNWTIFSFFLAFLLLTTSFAIKCGPWLTWTLSFFGVGYHCWYNDHPPRLLDDELWLSFFIHFFCKLSNLGFKSSFLLSIIKQTLQCTMWILHVRSTIAPTQGNWATCSFFNTLLISTFFFIFWASSLEVKPWIYAIMVSINPCNPWGLFIINRFDDLKMEIN